MMDELVLNIKEEPREDVTEEDSQLTQEMHMKDATHVVIKEELEENTESMIRCPEDEEEFFKIVQEQDNIITVAAGCVQSEDERKFINNITEQTELLSSHVNGQNSQCIVCPLTFDSFLELNAHYALHRLNRFFCRLHCGSYFGNVEDCIKHEFEQHQFQQLKCKLCEQILASYDELEQHMQIHVQLQNFVCSYCRTWFKHTAELLAHWHSLKDQTCGCLMQNVCEITPDMFGSKPPTSSISYRLKTNDATKKCTDANFTATHIKPTLSEQQEMMEIQIKNEPIDDNDFMHSDYNTFNQLTNTIHETDCDIKIENLCDVEIKTETIPENDNTITLNYNNTAVTNNSSSCMKPIVPLSMPIAVNIMPNFTLKTISPIDKSALSTLWQPTILQPAVAGHQSMPMTQNMALMKTFKLPPNIKIVKLPTNSKVMPITAVSSANKDFKITLPPLQTHAANNALAAVKPVNPNAKTAFANDMELPTPLKLSLSSSSEEELQQARLKYTKYNFDWQCVYCPFNFDQMSTLYNHLITKHNLIIVDLLKLVFEVRPTLKEVPQPLQLSLLNSSDALVEQARQKFTKYNFTWQCPHCPRYYEQKLAFHNHLISVHTQLNEDLVHCVFEVKPTLKDTFIVASTKLKRKRAPSFLQVLSSVVNAPKIKQESKKAVPDLQQLLENVKKVEENRERNVCLPKHLLHAIENTSEKRQLIVDMLQQIKTTEQSAQNLVQTEQQSLTNAIPVVVAVNEKTETTATVATVATAAHANALEKPAILQLSLMSSSDAEFQQARQKYANYCYVWHCPYCPRTYEQKRAFQNHLISLHTLTNEQLEQQLFDVKPKLRESFIHATAIANKNKRRGRKTSAAVKETTSADAAEIVPNLNRAPRRYVCSKCDRVCSSKTMLNDHIKGNCSRIPQYDCTICSKKFFSSSTLTCHMTIHTGEKPHKCSFCDKTFRTRGQLTVHNRTHTGERPFVCQVCSQSFTHRETLISHLSRHIGMRRYKCYACDKTFSCISGLRTHRDLRADTCGKVKFNSRAVGPRVRVIRGNVIFEAQPDINPYLRTEDPQEILAEIQNQQQN